MTDVISNITFNNDRVAYADTAPNAAILNGTLTVDYNTMTVYGQITASDINGDESYGPFSIIHDTSRDVYQIAGFGKTDSIHDSMILQWVGQQPNYATNISVFKGGSDYATTNDDPITAAPVCFAAGTAIRVISGGVEADVAIERLKVGDLVVTAAGGARPVRWLGSRRVDCRRQPDARPIFIAAHAFGPDRPMRDLVVSPGHALCVDVCGEVLIPAAYLLNGSTIVTLTVDAVTYWHVELEGGHDILLAENLPCESYLDMGNRGFFAGAGVVDLNALPDADAARRTHADFCRPVHCDGPVVEMVRARLRACAPARGIYPSSRTAVKL